MKTIRKKEIILVEEIISPGITTISRKGKNAVEIIFTMQTTVLTYEMKSMLKLTEVLSLISAVEFILCMLCSALSRTVKYDHII